MSVESGTDSEALVLKVDDRETRKPGRLEAIKKKRSYTVEVERLEVADYVLGPYAMEYKTLPDLYQSKNGRLWTQLDELEANYEYPVLVVETGNPDYQLSQNPKWRRSGRERAAIHDACMSVIASIQEKRRVIVLCVESPEEFADWLVVYAKRLKKKGRKGKYREPTVTFKKGQRSPSEQAFDVLCSLNGLGPKQCTLLAQAFPSLNALLNASNEEITAVPGIGDATADLIRSVFKAPLKKD